MKRILLLLLIAVSLFACKEKESEESRNKRIASAIQDSMTLDVKKLDSASVSDFKIVKVEEITEQRFAALKAGVVKKEAEDWEFAVNEWTKELTANEAAMASAKDDNERGIYAGEIEKIKTERGKAQNLADHNRKLYEEWTEKEKKGDAKKMSGYITTTSFTFVYYGKPTTFTDRRYLVSDKMEVDIYWEK